MYNSTYFLERVSRSRTFREENETFQDGSDGIQSEEDNRFHGCLLIQRVYKDRRRLVLEGIMSCFTGQNLHIVTYKEDDGFGGLGSIFSDTGR